MNRVRPVIASAFALALVLSDAASAQTVLKLEQYRRTIAARVEIAGKSRLMTFDTGGGDTIISEAIAKDIGCKPFGHLKGFRMTGDRLDTPRCDNVKLNWNGYPLTAEQAGVFDVTELFAKGAQPIDGMLSLKLFDGQTVTLDSAGLQLTIETPESTAERIKGATEVPAHLARETGGRALAVYIDVPTAHGPLSFELDSGNGGTLLVSKEYASEFGLDPSKDKPQPGTIPVATDVTARGLVFTPDLIIDGNLGMPFLKDHVVTLDLAAGRVWIKRNPLAAPAGMGVPPELKKS